MDGQRQQYIPAPPPPSISQPPQSHIISLPPPPPRHPPAQSHGVVPPPPPGPPPGAGYGVPSGWQQNWGRQGLPQGFPPPPPPPPPILPSNQPQNQHLAYGRQPAPLSILPPPPQSENQPLTSATYIPAGESFGPGVGIPPLFDSHPRSGYDAYGQSTGADRHQSYETVSSDGSYMRDGSIPPTPSNRNVPSSLVLHENVHELVSPGLPTATIQNPQPQSSGQGPELSKTPSHRHNSSNASLGGMSPSEAAIQWPLERVLLWLAENGFSSDWQETFKTLEIQGADFIELGHGGANGRGNLGKMHKVVYPQLAKECAKSGTGWDQGREREEGKRMRKLIRQIHDDGSTDAGIVVQKRRGSHPAVLSASSEGGLEHSPNLGWESLSAAPRNNMENSPSQNYTLKTSHSCFNQRQSMQLRSVTLPIPTTSHDSTAAELSGSARSDYSRNILSGLEHRRQSPSISSEGGPFAAPSLRPYEDSPQSGSPATQPASLSHPGLTSSSTGDLSVKSDHSRGNSTDSAMGSGRGHLATSRSGTGGVPGEAPSRFYEARRQGQEIARPSGQDSYTRQLSGEHSSYPKEHSKSFLNIFKKKSKNTDSTHASPEEQNLESPTSPVNTRNGSHLPFAKPGYNTSEVSLGERPSSASMSDHEKMSIWRRSINSTKGKKYAFATLDGWNYRLIDMTDLDSADSLRAAICQNLGVIDWTSAQIFLTEPGQIDHEEPLNDNMLVHSRRTKSDSIGTLKFYVRGTYAHPGTNISPHYAGLGVSISEKSTASPITGQHHLLRKPVDDDSGISPHSQPRPASPSPVSRQPVLKATTTDSAHELSPALPGASPVDGFWEAKQGLSPEKADLLARHEAHKREVERKQKQYNISKQPPPSQRKDNYSDLGYRREGVIDFDERRPSPFNDDKKPDSNLVPHRKPPSAPAGSTTLTKVNSLRRARPQQTTQTDLKQRPEVSVTEEMTERDNRKPVTPTSALGHGLGAAIASVGRMTSAIGTPSPSHAIQSGDFSLNGASRPSPVTSPAAEKPSQPVTESRKSYGPEFDFQETRVSFQQSPRPQEDSDEDSDDGLFAIPIAPNKNQSKGKQATPGSPETPKKSERPSLTLDTEPRLGKGLSVRFKSPNTSGDTSTGPSTHSSTSDTEQVPESRNTSNISSDDERSSRRDSFARDDIWASRPPVEGVIDHLDEFFPDIDLDEPYLEGNGISPPSSPTAVPNRDAVEHNANLKDKQADPAWAAQLNNENGDTLGSDGSAMKAKETNGITRRNATRAGGLGRMKSIREVAKGAHQVNRNRSVAHSTNANAAPLLRRKSTKMFGAKIMQISPRPGSRLSELDPIPQNAVPQDSIPQRQPTFRIIRGQLIGKGTYGRVYLGINADNGELLAVKQVEVNPKIAGQDKDRIKEMVAAMDQEIDTMQHLEHPNIVQYLGCERGEFSISIYLEYISGGSVGSCLRKHGKFEERVVKSLTRQTLSGLAYLHDQGILHRDLKADNILLDLDGTCKISDFGISKKSDNIYGNDSSNSMQGSVFWMAPEVIQSQGQGYSAKVDIWSLGCVVLEMFAGRRPWSKEEAIGAIFKLGSLNQAPPIPEDVSMNISPAALAFMYDCFTVDTFDRPTAETLLSRHPFCEPDPDYDFLKTELYAKIRHVL